MGAQALLIDFGGTLDADGEPWADRFYHMYQQAGGTTSQAAFQQAFRQSDEMLAATPAVATFDYSATVAQQATILGTLIADASCLQDAGVQEEFVTAAAAIARRNRDTLLSLSNTYLLAVVSNYQGNLAPCLDELELSDCFDVLSDSQLVGARKPDRRIFEATLEQLDTTAKDCWVIGDSPPNDIIAGQQLGMRTCWIAPASRLLGDFTPTARIARFDRLPLVLKP